MKILLLGNKGQVGHEIEELATAQSIEVIGYDIDSLDITNAAQVNAIFAAQVKSRHIAKHDGYIAINAAAYTAVDKAEDERVITYAVNCYGVKNLARACKQYDIPFLHISTDYVFDGNSTQPYAEDAITSPLGVYGVSKLAGEMTLEETWGKHIILRVGWVFGKYGSNFVKTILRVAQARDSLNVVGDQRGCPTAARDIARVLLELAAKINDGKRAWGIYHYCGAPVTTWYDFAKKIVELGREQDALRATLRVKDINKITTAEYPTKARRPLNSELVVKKITRDYGVARQGWLEYLEKVVVEIGK